MSDALLVLNASSSSLKFALFLRDDSLTPLVRGQIEGLFTSPRVVVRDPANCVIPTNEERMIAVHTVRLLTG